MTRGEKVAKVKDATISCIKKYIKSHKNKLKPMLEIEDPTEETEEQLFRDIGYLFMLRSLLYWVNSNKFCNEKWDNGDYILDDYELDVLLQESFDFVSSYTVAAFYYGFHLQDMFWLDETFCDVMIKNEMITVFDLISVKQENMQEG